MAIRAPQGVTVDSAKHPVVVVDPRAGHGSGVGGFKLDSEIGFALRAGHPVYFIGFYTEPVPGQTLVDVGQAESRFLEEVIRRHPGAGNKPFVIGNCQAGWAVAGLAAVRPELTGPVAFVGAPLSYWAGADSQNPMRYNGGIFGGTWPGNLLADLGPGSSTAPGSSRTSKTSTRPPTSGRSPSTSTPGSTPRSNASSISSAGGAGTT